MSYYNHVRKFQSGGTTGKRDPIAAATHDRFDLFSSKKDYVTPSTSSPLPSGIPTYRGIPAATRAFEAVSRRPAPMPIDSVVDKAINPVTITPVISSKPIVETRATSPKGRNPVRTIEKANSTSSKIKFIQRSLGVKADGLWGPKTQAAFEKMKATQESLGLTGKDVDGIRGMKTREALSKRDNEASASIQGIKALDTNDRSKDVMPNRVEPRTNGEMRKEGRRVRRILREEERELRRAARREDADFVFRGGGILYSQRK